MITTSDWDFPLRIDDQVRVTERAAANYYGLDGIVVEIENDAPTAKGPSQLCTIEFPDGRRNKIARYALTFISAPRVV